MKNLIKSEELLMFLFSAFLFSQLEYPWWLYFVLILSPDIGMLGYIFNTKVGAFIYNLFHHKGISVALLAIGMYLNISWIALTGIILFGHASMDRMFGYGLKFEDSFKNTHLGKLN